MTAKRLILENKLGQQVRSFQVEAETSNLIYRYDTRRIEMHTDLALLKEEGVEFQVIKKVTVASLEKRAATLTGLGTLRVVDGDAKTLVSPTYELPQDDDKERMGILLKKTAIGHTAAVVVLVLFSFAYTYFTKEEEPQLVTIMLPEKKEPEVRNQVQRVKMSEKKITPPKKTPIKKIADKNVIKPVTKPKINRKAPTPVVRQKRMVVRTKQTQNVNNMGALAALGGLKNGTRGYEGLDARSLKNIRSAGTGSGGGGVGRAGSGGVRGVMPGTGLIAGSSGSGGRAQGAGGYGTKGQGGGRAGYGKISLVGSTAGISLPIDEEASVQGGLDRDQIAAVINRRKGEIIYCYEQGLQNESQDLRGRVTVDFVINGKGRISTARVAQSSLGSSSVEKCMLAKMRNWQFPRPVGNVNVDVMYPFELRRVTSR